MPSISAIVPTFQRPALLARALGSIAAQEVRPTEVIVADDAEGGPTAATRAAAAAVKMNVRVIANTHRGGPSGARNAAAEAASGELLALLDDDDEWPPAYLRIASARFEAGGLDVTCADLHHRLADGTVRPGKRAPEALAADAFLTRNGGLGGSNLIIRRGRFLALGGFDESLPALEDMDLAVRASLLPGLRYAPVHEVAVLAHQHGGPRLCTPGGDAICAGVRRFYQLHRARMTAAQRQEFREVVLYWWGVDEHGRVIGAAGRSSGSPHPARR
jgi:glycosyltransferase involved in cell wall biosynthesis